MTAPGMTRAELLALPATLDVETAAKAIGVSRTQAYQLIRHNNWPTPVRRVGRLIKIPTEPILEFLGIARDTAPNVPRPRQPDTRDQT
jgi:predicted DNA-binding transcriptional regulator AlpA